ncbi:hypothetical protein KTQ83_02880 [Holdemanella porci]|uniref:Fic family protein n=1 Tax=Holdemanella porci TaxID=2652276 RepID=UPI001C2708C1|nr:hypothetical protein [Holdemanella porci]MBU9129464.1 hypothetical protein [Holdemanella porci]MBU9871302.1 hypothetical protein [Holdemanella porci]MBU9886485.1 hypothetical protein [Holdemanella porci]
MKNQRNWKASSNYLFFHYYNQHTSNDNEDIDLIRFCKSPKSRKEIAEYLDIKTTSFVTKEYIQPLVDAGKLKLTIPDKPKSKNQKYYSD